MNNKKSYLQQGDVLLAKVDEIPAEAVLTNTNVLQEGEHTGHAHRLDGTTQDFEVFEMPTTKEKFLKVLNPVALRHEEHRAFKIEPGNYKIGIVREYDPFQKLVRKVVD